MKIANNTHFMPEISSLPTKFTQQSSSHGVIIVAAGTGTRCNAQRPKQYCVLSGKTVLQHCYEHIVRALPDARICVVIHKDHDELFADCGLPKNVLSVYGGRTRQASVKAGMEALSDVTYVWVHDAARPFISADMCQRMLSAKTVQNAVIPVLPVVDTLKKITNGMVEMTLDREQIMRVQTPQLFHYDTLLELHKYSDTLLYTDDASLYEAEGLDVTTILGEEHAFKITTQDDMMRASHYVQPKLSDIRTGSGYDVHQFCAHEEGSNSIRLGGINIKHTHKLKGHSDADVVLHAVTDALLGAIGEGDIGLHFPPSNNDFKNMDSSHFVHFAYNLLKKHGGNISNLDITIIGERPKITPHRIAMQRSLASLLHCQESRINVKATTTEGLGFEGRSEGLAVHAIVTVNLSPPMLVS